MNNPAVSNPFIEYDSTYQEMNKIHNEIKQLCNTGKYDEAQQKVTDEYLPLQEKWRESQKHFFKYLNNHPDVYRHKS